MERRIAVHACTDCENEVRVRVFHHRRLLHPPCLLHPPGGLTRRKVLFCDERLNARLQEEQKTAPKTTTLFSTTVAENRRHLWNIPTGIYICTYRVRVGKFRTSLRIANLLTQPIRGDFLPLAVAVSPPFFAIITHMYHDRNQLDPIPSPEATKRSRACSVDHTCCPQRRRTG